MLTQYCVQYAMGRIFSVMTKLTKTEAAKKLGVTRRTVYNLVKRGTLVPDENGLIALNGGSIADARENVPINSHSVKGVLESSERLKDKYIAQLENQIELLKRQNVCLEDNLDTKRRYIASLEEQLKAQQYFFEELSKVTHQQNQLEQQQPSITVVEVYELARNIQRLREMCRFQPSIHLEENLRTHQANR